jgi:hypothetical protein
MNILVCLDDTDNLESRGTGELATMLASTLERREWGKSSYVTRHQLLVHPDIPYTSHNSAMCFGARLHEGCSLARFIRHAAAFLEREAAPGSDPGLCVAVPEQLRSTEPLIDFGRSAKERVLDKAGAYDLAGRLGVHLSEHGGTGQGVIGALAGIGLRLGGNDGRLKGRLSFGLPGECCTVASLLVHPVVEAVRTLTGMSPAETDQVVLGEKVKTVLLGGESVLLLECTNNPVAPWRTCTRQELKGY